MPIPNAYMTDEVYLGLVPKLCKGVREIPVVRDHKYWWCVRSLDVFGSHVNVHIEQEIFIEHKIIIVKEEGDTSEVCQAYDQWVAKLDKRYSRHNLHMVRKALGSSMNQYHIIKLVANTQLKVTKKEWVNSFICVNMHPKFWLPFKKLEDNRVLELGKNFLKEKGLYDAMPAFCRCMLVEIFHSCASAVDNLYGNKPE